MKEYNVYLTTNDGSIRHELFDHFHAPEETTPEGYMQYARENFEDNALELLGASTLSFEEVKA